MTILGKDIADLQKSFYDSLISSSNGMSLSQLWLVGIDTGKISEIDGILKKDLPNYEPNMAYPQASIGTADTIKSWFIGNSYCQLARSAQFPGDSIDVSRVGNDQSGHIKGVIGNGRSDMQTATITFLENNQSFADTFLRPWMIYAGHKSLKYFPIRIPITLIAIQKMGFNLPFVIRKKFVLKDAVPVNIDAEELNYTADKETLRQVQFAFSRYTIEDCNTTILQANPLEGINALKYILSKGYNAPTKSELSVQQKASLIDSAQNIIDTLADTVNKIDGKLSSLESNTLSILNSLGMDGESKEVQQLFSRLKKNTTQKASSLVNDASTVNNAVRSAKNVVGTFTGTNNTNNTAIAVDNAVALAKESASTTSTTTKTSSP